MRNEQILLTREIDVLQQQILNGSLQNPSTETISTIPRGQESTETIHTVNTVNTLETTDTISIPHSSISSQELDQSTVTIPVFSVARRRKRRAKRGSYQHQYRCQCQYRYQYQYHPTHHCTLNDNLTSNLFDDDAVW